MSRIGFVLSFDELRADVESGAIDTVVVAFTDMQGRLMGKRLQGEFFVDEIDAGHAVEGCNYLLALEMEMDPVPGYALASWERGYGDFGDDSRPGDAAADPVARGDGARPRATSAGTTARPSLPRRGRCSARRSSVRRRSDSRR